jgi:hypothetical protein
MRTSSNGRPTKATAFGAALLFAGFVCTTGAETNSDLPPPKTRVVEQTIVNLPTAPGITGAPSTEPANAADAKAQGKAAAASIVANAVVGYAASQAAKADAENAAKQALSHLPPGSIAIVLSQTTNYRNNEDSLLDGPMNRVVGVDSAPTLAQVAAKQAEGQEISKGATLDRNDIDVTATQQTMWKSVIGSDGQLAVVPFDPNNTAPTASVALAAKKPPVDSDNFLDDDDFDAVPPKFPTTPSTPTSTPTANTVAHEHFAEGSPARDVALRGPSPTSEAASASKAAVQQEHEVAQPKAATPSVTLTKDGEGFVHYAAPQTAPASSVPAAAAPAAPSRSVPSDAHSGSGGVGGHVMDGSHDVSHGHDFDSGKVADAGRTT